MKITAEQILDWEKNSLIDALGCELEMNDDFLCHCGGRLKSMLLPLTTEQRNEIIQGCVDESSTWWSRSGYDGQDDNQIFINVPEIETQIDSIDELENPDDFTIDPCGDAFLAYYYVGNGLLVGIDLEKLQSKINDLGKIDREELENLPIGGKVTQYLVKEGNEYFISNWPGTLKIRIWQIKKGNHNIAGTRSDVWFCYAGHNFHGVQYGNHSQICHITRVRD